MPDRFPIYDTGCPISGMLNLLSKRWVFFILRAVQHEVHSFTAIKRGLKGRISNRTLTDRLQELVKVGLLERRVDGRKIAYHFTTRGESALPLLEQTCRWAAQWEGLGSI